MGQRRPLSCAYKNIIEDSALFSREFREFCQIVPPGAENRAGQKKRAASGRSPPGVRVLTIAARPGTKKFAQPRKVIARTFLGEFSLSLVDKKDATPYPLCCNGFRLFHTAGSSFRGKESDRAGTYRAPALSDSFHNFNLMICSYSRTYFSRMTRLV